MSARLRATLIFACVTVVSVACVAGQYVAAYYGGH